jgi:hypothetical protein
MGKIKLGSFVTDIRNKVGGQVYSKNRGGAYVKNKVSPAQPRTTAQTTARSRMTTYAQGFRALTATQIAAWNAAVASFQKTDVFGDLKVPSGINLYSKLNINLAQVGGTAITTPPLPSAVVGPVTLTLTTAAGTPAFSLAFTVSPVAASTAWIVQATQQLSPGRSSVNSFFRTIGTIAAVATTPSNQLSNYNTKFGTLVAGQKIFVRVIPVSTVTGIKGTPLTTFAIVAA